jgi:hypothetical protein
MSEETQLRLGLGSIAAILFVIAGVIFMSHGDGAFALGWLSFGLVALTALLLVSYSRPT